MEAHNLTIVKQMVRDLPVRFSLLPNLTSEFPEPFSRIVVNYLPLIFGFRMNLVLALVRSPNA